MSDEAVRPTLTYPSGSYSATQVRLYGLLPDEASLAGSGEKASGKKFDQVSIELKKLGKAMLSIAKGDTALSCGIIVACSYEGRTYDLAKPKIMIIPAMPLQPIPKDDSGFDAKGGGYAVWIVDKLDDCVEFEISQGDIEQIVLEANLPGKRAPHMYAARMMMGHRSGRLTE
jgi:hypothetical protein